MGLVKTRPGTPQLPPKSPSLTRYGPNVTKYMAPTPSLESANLGCVNRLHQGLLERIYRPPVAFSKIGVGALFFVYV